MTPWITTHAEHEDAIARLSRRTPESLATFIVSLAQDRGPVGEQVRNFIVADDLAELVPTLEARIASIGDDGRHRYSNHQSGRPVGERLDFILDTIETHLLARHPAEAFRLLVLVIERDGAAMEIGMDFEFEISTAMERAAELIGKVATSLAPDDVLETLQRLIAGDGYGTRGALTSVVEALTQSR